MVEEKDRELFVSTKVLDKGFVRLVDYMGDDSRVVQSARVSYGSGTKTLREDRGLIRYLLRNAHTSPFEQVVFTFHIKMPIFVARQWIRHRTARLNEISARYSVMEDEFYVPQGEDINEQSKDNKQARKNETLPKQIQEKVSESILENQKQSYQTYNSLLQANIAREISRITLPTSLYTEMYWQIDLHNILHFLKLRLDSHAQREIQKYAQAIYEKIKKICPLTCDAFEDYVQQKLEFYKKEKEVLSYMLSFCKLSDEEIINLAEKKGITSQKERNMFLGKVRNLVCEQTSH